MLMSGGSVPVTARARVHDVLDHLALHRTDAAEPAVPGEHLFTAAPPTRNPLVRRVVDQVHTRLDGISGPRHPARSAGVIPRHLTRPFVGATGRRDRAGTASPCRGGRGTRRPARRYRADRLGPERAMVLIICRETMITPLPIGLVAWRIEEGSIGGLRPTPRRGDGVPVAGGLQARHRHRDTHPSCRHALAGYGRGEASPAAAECPSRRGESGDGLRVQPPTASRCSGQSTRRVAGDSAVSSSVHHASPSGSPRKNRQVRHVRAMLIWPSA